MSVMVATIEAIMVPIRLDPAPTNREIAAGSNTARTITRTITTTITTNRDSGRVFVKTLRPFIMAFRVLVLSLISEE